MRKLISPLSASSIVSFVFPKLTLAEFTTLRSSALLLTSRTNPSFKIFFASIIYPFTTALPCHQIPHLLEQRLAPRLFAHLWVCADIARTPQPQTAMFPRAYKAQATLLPHADHDSA